MSVIEHLEALRRALIISLLASGRHVSSRPQPVHQLRVVDGHRVRHRLRAARGAVRAGDAADHKLALALQAAAILLSGFGSPGQLPDARRRSADSAHHVYPAICFLRGDCAITETSRALTGTAARRD